MRRAASGMIGLLVFCAALGAQAPKATEKDLIGLWAGRYDGGSGGGTFEMTIARDAQGKLGGNVSPKSDSGESYTVPLTTVQFADGKATLKCPDSSGEAEVTVDVTIEGTGMKGTFIVRARSDGSELDRGTVTASKKK
jgi:hypothetical protein